MSRFERKIRLRKYKQIELPGENSVITLISDPNFNA